MAAVEAVAASATGHVGLVARHLETGQSLSWHPDRPVKTASTVKVAIHAALMRQVRRGLADLSAEVVLAASDQTGGSGILAVLRPGLRCTVADLCTLMIVVSDNTATNMVIDICGGVDSVNQELVELGFGSIKLDHKINYQPPPLVPGDRPAAQPPARPLAMATPAELCRLVSELHAGTVVDPAASAQIVEVLRHQQSQSLMPRAYLDVAEPGDPPGPDGPGMAHKTGSVGGCRAETGLLYLPGNGGTVAYAAAADDLADRSMTALAEGNQILGRLGAIVLARWWPGPRPVPVRDGWLP
jgi:beta-lactamase class A